MLKQTSDKESKSKIGLRKNITNNQSTDLQSQLQGSYLIGGQKSKAQVDLFWIIGYEFPFDFCFVKKIHYCCNLGKIFNLGKTNIVQFMLEHEVLEERDIPQGCVLTFP